MSTVFEAATTAESPAEHEQTQTNESFVEQLVGEGKKFKDLEALAKGKLEADKHIGEITKTLDELRADLAKQDYAKSLLEQMNKGSEAKTEHTPPPESGPSKAQDTTYGASDLESLVEKVLTEKERNKTVAQNISAVSEEMEKQFGDKAGQILKTKSIELGMSVERLKEIASESPNAFFQLIGVTQPRKPMSITPQSTIRSEGFTTNSQERDFDFYQKLRKENRSQYYSPKIQNMMIQDRERLGSKFYKS